MNYRSFSGFDNKNKPLDQKLLELFNYKKDGFFIELGANDGISQSNTAMFEFYFNWKGILIEPSIIGFNKCQYYRKNSVCLNYACVSNNYTSKYIMGDFKDNNLQGSIDGKQLLRKKNIQRELIKVKTITLEKILDLYLDKNKKIDLLSLDTEGYELNILKGLNLNKYRPYYILVEITNITNENYKNVLDFLKLHNYELYGNFTNFNKTDNPGWSGDHNDFLFVDYLVNKK